MKTSLNASLLKRLHDSRYEALRKQRELRIHQSNILTEILAAHAARRPQRNTLREFMNR